MLTTRDESPVEVPVRFDCRTLEEFLERHADDVSHGGVFIRTGEPQPVGRAIRLDLQLSDGVTFISGEGTVFWNRSADPARPDSVPGMGVRFSKLSGRSQGVLAFLLNEKAVRAQAQQWISVTDTCSQSDLTNPIGLPVLMRKVPQRPNVVRPVHSHATHVDHDDDDDDDDDRSEDCGEKTVVATEAEMLAAAWPEGRADGRRDVAVKDAPPLEPAAPEAEVWLPLPARFRHRTMATIVGLAFLTSIIALSPHRRPTPAPTKPQIEIAAKRVDAKTAVPRP
jgi:uncharacterized protein (TIGR02266 family)